MRCTTIARFIEALCRAAAILAFATLASYVIWKVGKIPPEAAFPLVVVVCYYEIKRMRRGLSN
ncbi:MAG: hypothetical protein HQ582_08250 [Planctomycetes bacterium]|nr:hypothetical protein [Planctomycetota bacterium]